MCCYTTVQCVIHLFNLGFYRFPNPFARFSNKLIGEKNTFILFFLEGEKNTFI